MSDANKPTGFENPSIMSHISVGTNNFKAAIEFYDKILAVIGARRVLDFPDQAVAYGKQFPEFWVHPPCNGQPAETANGVHFAFFATNQEMVNTFYQTALKAGAKDDGKPGPRKDYGPAYYGCFVRDLDGHKIEAVYWDESKTETVSS